MSIEQLNDLPEQEEVEQNERQYWKEQANILGLTYPNNIPTEKLRFLVQEKIAEPPKNSNVGTKGLTYTEKLAPEVRQMQDEATKLVRFRLHVLDPNLSSWTGMYVTVGNDNLTPIRRAVYFIEEPWHAEAIIVEALKSMKYAHRPTKANTRLRTNLNDHDKPKMLPKFHVEILPPLTEEELQELAKYQAQNKTGQQED